MKTLNEVIKANECCDHGELDSRCEDCPYNGIGACCLEREIDALYYLKEYREKQNILKGKWQITSIKGETWGVCSNCGFKQKAGELNFCPNCGTNMRGNDGTNKN